MKMFIVFAEGIKLLAAAVAPVDRRAKGLAPFQPCCMLYLIMLI